ncbi:MAG: RNA methyltransferase [Flavisolibacter sp.]|nr:RNA methyltransferase [Flavisolibacter sp.]MBD0294011.1 RNA methyltransferase [Flavisolibacter sp.]MBD0367321.1 RNA methyltransferase [Flavisolibacter sp.]
MDDNRKCCIVKLISAEQEEGVTSQVTIAISLIKNTSRFEWFLEKATEIGVRQMIPLLCKRTEKEKFRYDRMHSIVMSAMLQSQQCWLPHVHQPTNLEQVLKESTAEHKWIAHCLPQQKSSLSHAAKGTAGIILIGPEGDFTETEIAAALQHGFSRLV